MALNNNDLFLVNQGGTSKKIKYSNLKKNLAQDVSNDLQTVTENGNTTDKIIETSGGVKVTDGASDLLAETAGGIGYNSNQDFIQLSARDYDASNVAQGDASTVLRLSNKRDYNGSTIVVGGNIAIKSNNGNISFNPARTLSIGGVSTSANQQLHQQTTAAPFQHNDSTSVAFYYPRVQDTVFDEADLTTWIDKFDIFNLGVNRSHDGSKNPNIRNITGLRLGSSLGTNTWSGTGRQTNCGIDSQLQYNSARDNYNFHASGDAPNFFAGSTYIGGTATRNTYELWESTLTEEQKEQLTAGTLTIPANVSTPGDGSFVRQWWYDQQSAEDQALIDSGELEYPEQLQAANFTDTFALGDNTNINLNASGLGEFKGGVKVAGGTEANVECGIIATGNHRLKFVTNFKNYLDINRYGNILSNADIDQETSANYVNFNSTPALTTQRTAGQTLEVSNFKAGLQSFDNPNGAKIQYKGFWVENPNANIDDGDATEVYGFYSQVANQLAAGQVSYNFYAAGLAPNYFAGNITCDGKINGTFNLRMESDDPNAYQTTYSTDEEGNQVEKSTYLGTTEDLLSIIKDLRTRIAALESNEVSDDATDSALLTLVANLSARVLTLEGGN